MKKFVTLIITLVALLSFGGLVSAQEPATATAELQDVDGNSVGTVTFTEGADGVAISATISGLAGDAGEHGIHLHAVGSCSPDFSAAGGHFNPTEAQHGLDNPNGPHAGDGPNLVLDENGNGTYEAIDNRVTLGEGDNSLLDADGSAIVIHAGPDDQMTDPSGNSGDRIACGVIMADQAAEGDMAADDTATGDMVEEETTDETGTGDIAAEEAPAEETPAQLPQSGGVNHLPATLFGLGALLLISGAILRKTLSI